MSLALEGTPSTPTASLSSLPIEIKSIIVNLAHEQDENYARRINSKNKDESELIEGVLKENRWRGKSLNALFLVNKEFSNLAAVHIFKILSSDQVDGDSFLYEILPQRGNLIRSVQFSESFLPETLLYLFALSSLETLNFSAEAIIALFGDLVEPGISGTKKQNSHYSALLAAGRRVKSLDIESHQASHLNGILAAFPVLKKLVLYLLSKDEDQYDDEKMLQLGTKLSQYSFESLDILFTQGGIPESWNGLEWNSANSLTQLKCTFHDPDNELNISFFSFLNNFTSLEYLKFSFTEFSSSLEKHIDSNPQQFTSLIQLDINCSIDSLSSILPLFTSSPIRTFRFETGEMEILNEEESTLEATLIKFANQHQQTLKVIEICDRIIRINLPSLIQLCSSKFIILSNSVWSNQQIYDELYPLPDTSQFNYRRPILEKALDFGKNKLIELENDNDVEGLKEMFDKCKWLRAITAEYND